MNLITDDKFAIGSKKKKTVFMRGKWRQTTSSKRKERKRKGGKMSDGQIDGED